MFERFTDRARKVMALANEEATRLNHEYIATEHILLGVIKDGNGSAAKLLIKLQGELSMIRSAVEQTLQARAESLPHGKRKQTPHSKKTIELAIDEARSMNHHNVGTEHILLGLLRQPETTAGQVLAARGITASYVRMAMWNISIADPPEDEARIAVISKLRDQFNGHSSGDGSLNDGEAFEVFPIRKGAAIIYTHQARLAVDERDLADPILASRHMVNVAAQLEAAAAQLRQAAR